MRMIMRLLMMFGPMLFRMYKKFQKKQAIQQSRLLIWIILKIITALKNIRSLLSPSHSIRIRILC